MSLEMPYLVISVKQKDYFIKRYLNKKCLYIYIYVGIILISIKILMSQFDFW